MKGRVVGVIYGGLWTREREMRDGWVVKGGLDVEGKGEGKVRVGCVSGEG